MAASESGGPAHRRLRAFLRRFGCRPAAPTKIAARVEAAQRGAFPYCP